MEIPKEILDKAGDGGFDFCSPLDYGESRINDPLFWQALSLACGWSYSELVEANSPMWQENAIIFHTTNLTEGWDSAVDFLSKLIKE